MSWLPIAIEAGTAIYGGIQKATNKRPKDPKYSIPSEVYGYLGELKNRADNGMPGMDMMVENILSQGAGTTAALKETAVSGASLQGSVNQVASGVMSGMRDVEIMNSKFKDGARVDYARGLMEMAQYKDKQWDYNVNQPHIQAMTEYFNTEAAADQNLFGGLQGAAEYAWMNNMYKGYSSGATGTSPSGTGSYPWYDMGNGVKQSGYEFGYVMLPPNAKVGSLPGEFTMKNGKYYKNR